MCLVVLLQIFVEGRDQCCNVGYFSCCNWFPAWILVVVFLDATVEKMCGVINICCESCDLELECICDIVELVLNCNLTRLVGSDGVETVAQV